MKARDELETGLVALLLAKRGRGAVLAALDPHVLHHA